MFRTPNRICLTSDVMLVWIVMLHVEAESFQRSVAEHLNVSQSVVSWPDPGSVPYLCGD